jgi:mono/diheme cytochrome c family protein
MRAQPGKVFFAVFAAFAFSVAAVSLHAQAPAESAPAGNIPTYSKDVAPIFYKNCTGCHRAGEIGPMALVTYQDARPWAKSIATRVAAGTMPPWHGESLHALTNDRRLSDADKATIVKWATNGAPEGNKADLSAAPTFADGWQVGQPDAVFTLQEDYPVPASGTIEYKYFEVPTNFTEDKWVKAFEVRPGDRRVVHHIIVFGRPPARPAAPPSAETTSTASTTTTPAPRPQPPFTFAPGMQEPRDEAVQAAKRAPNNDRPAPRGGTGPFVADFAPGQSVRVYAEDSALRVQAGTTLVFQIHYTASGKATTDRSRIGMVFANEKPKTEVMIAALQNANFTLPAGQSDARVDAEMTLNRDTTLWSLLPHTHVRGKRWEYQAVYPDGRTETILSVPKYDFNWQTEYVFKQPLKLPKGTKIHSTAWYDNSTANKSNPDPSVDVHWGDQTWQEMQFTAFAFTLDPVPQSTAPAQK